jgi:hypothetical protein
MWWCQVVVLRALPTHLGACSLSIKAPRPRMALPADSYISITYTRLIQSYCAGIPGEGGVRGPQGAAVGTCCGCIC